MNTDTIFAFDAAPALDWSLDDLFTAACNWLAAHPRITCALVCGLILAAFRIAGTP